MRAIRRVATHSCSSAVRQQFHIQTRAFGSSVVRWNGNVSLNGNGNGNGNSTGLNPRWFTDLRSRIKACLATNPQGQDGETLKKHLEYVDSNWLELAAGREGFLTAERWRGLNKFAVAWGDMVSFACN